MTENKTPRHNSVDALTEIFDTHAIGEFGLPEAHFDVELPRRTSIAIDPNRIKGTGVSKRESVFAIRNLLDLPEIRDLARELRRLVTPLLGEDCVAVRGIFFDKTPDANWKVPYHQDLSIAVKERREVAGFGPWSEKAGAIHVQPPAWVLGNMLTVRLHLDDCGENNGALCVIPGSDRHGKLESGRPGELTGQGEVTVPVPSGGAMLMRPLLLHASSPAQSASHRRVIHLEFAGVRLPGGLEWLHSV